MLSLSTHNPSFAFIAALVGAIAFMLILMFSIWRDGQEVTNIQEMSTPSVSTHSLSQQSQPISTVPPSRSVTPERPGSASANPSKAKPVRPGSTSKGILSPAPDFEPVAVHSTGE